MSTCWKCGSQVANGEIECQNCLDGIKHVDLPTPPPLPLQDWQRRLDEMIPVDWDRVKTLDDMKLIMRLTNFAVHPDHQMFDKIKHLLRGGGA